MTVKSNTISLHDGRVMTVDIETYPISREQKIVLIDLWRTEWTRTDYDWLEAMYGDYAETLKIRSIVGHIDSEPAGTASVYHATTQPEVATIGNVLTHPYFRHLGIAEHLTNLAIELAVDTGCRAIYLGATRTPQCMYLKCGFQWYNGGVMRYVTKSDDAPEQDFFTPGQKITIRDAQWGDLSAFACFVVQPIETSVLDYPRGLISGRYVTLQRCVSNFPAVYRAVHDSEGVMRVLVGDVPNRVLGFGSLTLGPAPSRRHVATLDFAIHDNYTDESLRMLADLLGVAGQLSIECVETYVADTDIHKHEFLELTHFKPIATLNDRLMLRTQLVPVQVMAWFKSG